MTKGEKKSLEDTSSWQRNKIYIAILLNNFLILMIVQIIIKHYCILFMTAM